MAGGVPLPNHGVRVLEVGGQELPVHVGGPDRGRQAGLVLVVLAAQWTGTGSEARNQRNHEECYLLILTVKLSPD